MPAWPGDQFLTSNNQPATLTSAFSLLPGVLYAYKAAQTDLAYVGPLDAIPEPEAWTLVQQYGDVFAGHKFSVLLDKRPRLWLGYGIQRPNISKVRFCAALA